MNFLTKATAFLARCARIAPAVVFVVCGLSMCAIGIYLGSWIPGKSAAVLVSAFSSLAGGVVCALAGVRVLDELRGNAEDNQARLVEENSVLRLKSTEVQSKLQQALRERDNLDQQIEGLKRMRIDVSRWEEVLKLGLLEFDGQFTHFQRQKLVETNPQEKLGGLWTDRGETHEYLGFCDVRFRALAGVDLMKIRVRAEDKRLVISGFASPFQSFMNVRKEWLLNEVRVVKAGGTLPNSYQVQEGHPQTRPAMIQHDKLLQERLNAGADLQQVHSFLSKRSQEFVRRLLAPVGKEIVFIESDAQGGRSLVEFLTEHDRDIAGRIVDLEQQRAKTLSLPS